jgi:hypothetical protein
MNYFKNLNNQQKHVTLSILELLKLFHVENQEILHIKKLYN